MTIGELRQKLAVGAKSARSAWARGVYIYSLELIENYKDGDAVPSKEELLNGASDWYEYSYGGCSLIYDGDIAERLCTPKVLKRTKNGEKRPNSREEWLDVQARALTSAYRIIRLKAAKYV